MNRSNSKPSRRQRKIKAVTTSELHGGKFSPSENPPDITYQAWYPLTVVIQAIGEKQVTYSDLLGSLKKQIDPTGNLLKNKASGDDKGVVITKIRSIRAWNLSGKIIGLTVFDYMSVVKSNSAEAVCGIIDTGNTNHTPSVGYHLSSSLSNYTLRNGNNDDNDEARPLFNVFSSTNDTAIIYVNVFWRCDGPVKLTGFSDEMLKCLRGIKENTHKLRSTLSVSVKNRAINPFEWIPVKTMPIPTQSSDPQEGQSSLSSSFSTLDINETPSVDNHDV